MGNERSSFRGDKSESVFTLLHEIKNCENILKEMATAIYTTMHPYSRLSRIELEKEKEI